MRLVQLALLAATLISMNSASANGVITGGGGGITNPEPVRVEEIGNAVYRYGFFALRAWSERRLHQFNNMTEAQRAAWPLNKLFSGSRNILGLLESARVEIRRKRGCFDAGGNEWDGSVLPSAPDVICLSAFRMAPKLSFYNVEVETIALAAHELSHLLGADEQEARAIQMQFIRDFAKTNFEERLDDASTLSAALSKGLAKAENAIEVPKIFERFTSKDNRLWYVSAALMIRREWMAANDRAIKLRRCEKPECASELERIFGGREKITLAEYAGITGDGNSFCGLFPSYCFNAEMQRAPVEAPRDHGRMKAIEDGIAKFVRALEQSLKHGLQFHININYGEN